MPALPERISINPSVMFGKPCIKGTRVTVETILRRMSEGASVEAVLSDYPHLTDADIRAALAYALAVVSYDETLTAAE